MIRPNEDKETYNKIVKAVEKNEGYCPCVPKGMRTEKNLCSTKKPCDAFIEKCQKGYKGKCTCGMYVND